MIVLTVIVLVGCATVKPTDSQHCSGELTAGNFAMQWYSNGSYVQVNASVPTETWVAVGFSNDRLMPDTDAIIGGRNDSGDDYFLEDRFASSRARPDYDSSQDIYDTAVYEEDGTTTISFKRLLVTGDTDGDKDIDRCVYVLWAWGGSISSYDSPAVFGGHTSRGVFSDQLCINECDSAYFATVSMFSLVITVLVAVYANTLF